MVSLLKRRVARRPAASGQAAIAGRVFPDTVFKYIEQYYFVR
jgi:hypothetical protein